MPVRAVLSKSKRTHRAALLWPTAMAATTLLLLLGLGSWQLDRLQWKQGLLDRITERVHAPPVPFEQVALPADRPATGMEYLHVRLKGRFRHDLERYAYATG